MVGYILIGCIISYSTLYDDKTLSKPHWLLALIMLAMAWPIVLIAPIIDLCRGKKLP